MEDDEHDSILESDGESLKYDEDEEGDDFDVEEYKGAEEDEEDELDSDDLDEAPVSTDVAGRGRRRDHCLRGGRADAVDRALSSLLGREG